MYSLIYILVRPPPPSLLANLKYSHHQVGNFIVMNLLPLALISAMNCSIYSIMRRYTVRIRAFDMIEGFIK